MRSLPQAIMDKLHSNYQTVYNDANIKIDVYAARAKNTVDDSTYWTVETIRETSGLGDISVAPRRFAPYGHPNRLYEIHVHNGEVVTATKEYPDLLKEGWIDQFSLGAGLSVAIAFDGHWERYRNLWRLVTDEKPWVMWVDAGNILWAQLWDDASTKIELDTGVTKVKALRAWKNTVLVEQDQGIVAGYIKSDGSVWYRNYCQQADYTSIWESPRQVMDFTGTAVSLNLFLANDYRMGFVIEDSIRQIHLLVTPRNWGGMASPSDVLVSRTTVTFDVIPIAYHDMFASEQITASATIDRFYLCPADAIPEILSVERLSFTDNKTIEITFNYTLECDLNNLIGALSLVNTYEEPFTIAEITQEGAVLTIKTVEEMPEDEDVIIRYDAVGTYWLAFRINELCLRDYGQAIEYTIEGIHLEPLEPGEVGTWATLAASTEVSFEAIRVYYTHMYDGGHIIEVDMVITFEVTQVGTNPL